MSTETNPTLLSISPSTLSSFVSESTAFPSLIKHTTLNSSSLSAIPSFPGGASVATGMTPTLLSSTSMVPESLAISNNNIRDLPPLPIDANMATSLPESAQSNSTHTHPVVVLGVVPTPPSLNNNNNAPVTVIPAPPGPIESLTGSRSTHNSSQQQPQHLTVVHDTLQDKKTFFERRASQNQNLKRLSIRVFTPTSVTDPAHKDATVALSSASTTTSSFSLSQGNNKSTTGRLTPSTSNLSLTASTPLTTANSSPLFPALSFGPTSNIFTANATQLKDDVLDTTAATATKTFVSPSSPPAPAVPPKDSSANKFIPKSPTELRQQPQESLHQPLYTIHDSNSITLDDTMSSSPTTTSPISTHQQANGHNNLFNHNSSMINNNTGPHLRSPSLSSGTGSGNGQTTTNSTSSSSATTTITTTHSSSFIGTSGGAAGTTNSMMSPGLGTSSVSDLKLKRFLEHNQRLKEQLEMRRITVSEASQSLIKFVTSTKDTLLPSLWGQAASDPFSKQSSGCCTIS